MGKKYISWRRVSTKRQGASGLGLEAQKEIIRYFIEHDGGEWIADYKECYTGTELSGCVELHKAMEHAKMEDAILIIAKTDRFRNTAEALKIYEQMGDGHLMFCDLPHTNKFMLTLFFALAEREALIVSIRTRQALAAKKARGEKTGGASQAWLESYTNKSEEQKHKESMERGKMKSARFLQSKDVQVFLRVIKNVCPDECVGEPHEWKWGLINTRNGRAQRILSMMQDYQAMDESGTLFRKWDFAALTDKQKLVKLCAWLQTVRKSVRNNIIN